MQHYFIDKPHTENDFFEFTDNIINLELCFRSCDSIFSKDRIDDGTRTLVETITKKTTLSGHGLDLGCGLGVIAISLIKHFGVKFDMVDINATAVILTKQNLIKNNVQRSATAYVSDGFNAVDGQFDFIVSNPPIKVGKQVLFKLMSDSFAHLKTDGYLYAVIRKDHGMQSLKNHLIDIYGNCEILSRNKGYYVLVSHKN